MKHSLSQISLAIVVPVYNVELYLCECLKSIENQTFSNWKCYIINDGSIDKSEKVADAFVERDPRFIQLNKENGGVSSARNLALRHINKSDFDFIAFIDSDDIIPQNYLQTMISTISKEDADMAVCPMVKFDKNGIISQEKCHPIYQVLEGDLIADMYFLSGKGKIKFDYNRMLGNKLFRQSSVKDKYFKEHLKGAEDQDWMIDNLLQINKVVCTPETHYLYRQRNSSLAHSFKCLQDYNTFHRIMLSSYPQYSPFSQECIQNRFIETFYNQVIASIENNDNILDIRSCIHEGKKIIREKFKQQNISSRSMKRLNRLDWPLWFLQCYLRYWPKKQKKLTNPNNFG